MQNKITKTWTKIKLKTEKKKNINNIKLYK